MNNTRIPIRPIEIDDNSKRRTAKQGDIRDVVEEAEKGRRREEKEKDRGKEEANRRSREEKKRGEK